MPYIPQVLGFPLQLLGVVLSPVLIIRYVLDKKDVGTDVMNTVVSTFRLLGFYYKLWVIGSRWVSDANPLDLPDSKGSYRACAACLCRLSGLRNCEALPQLLQGVTAVYQ